MGRSAAQGTMHRVCRPQLEDLAHEEHVGPRNWVECAPVHRDPAATGRVRHYSPLPPRMWGRRIGRGLTTPSLSPLQ